jgi:hypothetical protein
MSSMGYRDTTVPPRLSFLPAEARPNLHLVPLFCANSITIAWVGNYHWQCGAGLTERPYVTQHLTVVKH